MKTELTEQQVKAYMANGGALCPECGSANIEAGSFESDSNEASCRVDCACCGASWVEGYTLTSVLLIRPRRQSA